MNQLFNLFDQTDETIARNNRTIALLRAAHPHMKAMGDALKRHAAPAFPRLDNLVEVANFIGTANLLECKHIINELIERVSALNGDASRLEDASCQLTAEIEAQDLLDNPPICGCCNGSGEGQYDGTRCMSCHGTGTEVCDEN